MKEDGPSKGKTRINLALSDENLDFVRDCAELTDQSMTRLINYMVEFYRREHPEVQALLDERRVKQQEDQDKLKGLL